jgi:hypothetical protein
MFFIAVSEVTRGKAFWKMPLQVQFVSVFLNRLVWLDVLFLSLSLTFCFSSLSFGLWQHKIFE